ncbi:hypothetical protein DYB32_009067 [Aphanomyces invadans]|uniref:HSF-type DNA-binding domain-containing protein n=1 Tax=Aphanomyces invadans TaxID=157072 RepID=A0A418AJE1_9STRA|nr:hypothetical protein DYB32_009067 [Aphanomyces invadans]
MDAPPTSPFQLHIQLPEAYMPPTHHHQLYYGTPTTPDSHDMYSGDESPASRAGEIAPFLRNLRNMLERESPEVLRWNKDGTAFEIHNMDEMMNSVLPKYFKHKKYTSFQRQLNYFNFKKWTKSRANVCTFSNELFTRHDPFRSAFITRKKSISGSKDPNLTDTGDEYEDSSGRPSCDSPCSSVCDSPVLGPTSTSLSSVPKGTLDLSFESLSLHKARMSPYENKHLTRVLGGRKAMRKMRSCPAPVERSTPLQPHMHTFVDDLNWFGDTEFNHMRDSATSMTSGEWDDDPSEMNWVDLLPYNDDATFFDPPSQTSDNSLSPLRGPFVPSNTVTFFAAL